MTMNDVEFSETIAQLVHHKADYDASANHRCFEIEAVFPPRGKYADLFVRFVKVPSWHHPAYPESVHADAPHTHVVHYGRAYCKHEWLYPGENVADPKPIRIHLADVLSWFPGHVHNMVVTAEYNPKLRRFAIHEDTGAGAPIVSNALTTFDKSAFARLHARLSTEPHWTTSQTALLDICGSGQQCGLRMSCQAKALPQIKTACRQPTVDKCIARLTQLQQAGTVTWQNNVRGSVDNPWYQHFRVKTKTEVETKHVTHAELKTFLLNFKDNTYRYKKRYNFCERGIEVSLTMVKEQPGHLASHMSDALKSLASRPEKYELEVEYVGEGDTSSAASALRAGKDMVRILRKCLAYMQPVRNELARYPADETVTQIIQHFNHTLYPTETEHPVASRFCMKNPYVPTVVSLTPDRMDRLDLRQYTLFSKTDGYRSIGFVWQSTLYLLVEQKTCVAFPLSSASSPVNGCFVVDGEVYAPGNGRKLHYYIFDVYASPHGLVAELPLHARLQLARSLVGNAGSIVVHVKRPSTVEDGVGRIDYCECEGVVPRNDGYILMYAGPLTQSAAQPPMRQLVAMKWKTVEDCTADFRVQYDIRPPPPDGERNMIAVTLHALFTSHSNLSLHALTALTALTATPCATTTALPALRADVPFEPHDTAFVDPSLMTATAVVALPCDEKGVVCFGDEQQLLLYPTEIAEMQYDSHQRRWSVVRKRTDKTAPNALGVAIDNWELAHQPDFAPSENKVHDVAFLSQFATAGQTEFAQPTLDASSYYRASHAAARKTCGVTQYHNALKRSAVRWAVRQVGATTSCCADGLEVLELGCGRGTELVTCFMPMHVAAQPIKCYVGVDIDADGLLRASDGAYWRYHTMLQREQRTGDEVFPVVFLQGDCTRDVCGGSDDGDALDLAKWTHLPAHQRAYRRLFGAGQPSCGTFDCRLQFDVISVQFALHYMYRSPEFWRSLERLMRPGSMLVATVPNGEFITDKLTRHDGYYTVLTHDGFEFRYRRPDEPNGGVVCFSSTNIHEQEEPLFFASICRNIMAQHTTSLTCDIRSFATSDICDRDAAPTTRTDSEMEYSEEGHSVVVIRCCD